MEFIVQKYKFSPLRAFVEEYGRKDVVFSWELVAAARKHGVELRAGGGRRLGNPRRAQAAGYAIVKPPHALEWSARGSRGKAAYVSLEIPEQEREQAAMDAFLSLL